MGRRFMIIAVLVVLAVAGVLAFAMGGGMSAEDAAALAEVKAGGGTPLTEEQIMNGR